MDEHQTNGMTEFLKREIRAWDGIAVDGIYKKGRRRRVWLMLATAVVALAMIIAAVLVWAPWSRSEPPVQQPGGAENESEQGTGTVQEEQTGEQESTPGTQGMAGRDPYAYDFSAVPTGAVPIVPMDITAKNHPVNQTDRVIDMQEVLAAACKIPAARGQVSVLIIHTHTGEGYNREGALYLEEGDGEFARSTDGSDGVVAVGERVAQILNQAGIGTIHCKTVFDGESNRDAYARAADAIAAFQKAYPSLICVIDLHRAASTDQEGHIVRSLAVQNGESIAQTQLICGMSAESTSKTNLALAMRLYERMNQAFGGSCAGVICKEQTLNQDCAPFCLTLEVGSSGNTPKEALAGAEVAARALCTLFEKS